ncbi:glycoside hydrolase family 73 protein [Loigolactobacillus bifermentans]|uniref:Mannosyl-glycoprotein endo-beta-N-acetylglucosamidase-like domain-containing protein n=1 Tax=Loigolactobacillus bifermentans DSM 20003 TaxID=1423726 RepID=A0A0R1GDP0_9LACO|nr:glucosaminidase domain-containing protein [Loigolactobacillus bifermentans]KRK32397.1 hypothetical protein FC07_GL002223 [Loigolactobacillus bifermentans DSM 20003]QGG60665.1 hypothetical protein LB003_09435 [Loigolactobacillus bifermentans]
MKKWFWWGLLGWLVACSPVQATTDVSQLAQQLWQQEVRVSPALNLAPAQQTAFVTTWQAYLQATQDFQQGKPQPQQPTAIEQLVWATLQPAQASGLAAGRQQALQQLPLDCAPPPDQLPVAQVIYQQAYHQAYEQQVRAMATAALTPDPPVVTPPPLTPTQPVTAPSAAPPPAPSQPQVAAVPQVQWRPTQAAFFKRFATLAQRISRQYDLYPSIMLAQAALESNWGQSELAQAPYYNLFGVKATSVHQVRLATLEADDNGQLQPIQAAFERYSSYRQSLLAYARLLSLPLYQGAKRQESTTYQTALVRLAQRYATDPHYALKIQQLIVAYHLQRYDAPPKLQQHFQAPPRQLLPGRQRLWQPTPASQHLNWPNAQGWSFLIASWLPERPSKLA